VPDGVQPAGDRSLHLPRSHFAQQLDALVKTHDVIALDRVLSDSSDNRRPRAAITFDDAYTGAVTMGVDELAKRELPATIFVAPAYIGRRRALEEFDGEETRIRAWARRGVVHTRPVQDYLRPATEEELCSALRHNGITCASHSWSHPNLPRLDPARIRRELVQPLRWLTERFDSVIAWLAYPYGISSPVTDQLAADVGYQGSVLASGGWLPTRPQSCYSLPRLNVPSGLSLDGFVLRAVGLVTS
jgi:peptidoglycan/xylan/chitin deacetylase (PgdA/CDA1 family)